MPAIKQSACVSRLLIPKGWTLPQWETLHCSVKYGAFWILMLSDALTVDGDVLISNFRLNLQEFTYRQNRWNIENVIMTSLFRLQKSTKNTLHYSWNYLNFICFFVNVIQDAMSFPCSNLYHLKKNGRAVETGTANYPIPKNNKFIGMNQLFASLWLAFLILRWY